MARDNSIHHKRSWIATEADRKKHRLKKFKKSVRGPKLKSPSDQETSYLSMSRQQGYLGFHATLTLKALCFGRLGGNRFAGHFAAGFLGHKNLILRDRGGATFATCFHWKHIPCQVFWRSEVLLCRVRLAATKHRRCAPVDHMQQTYLW
jgi:hypothetical protein